MTETTTRWGKGTRSEDADGAREQLIQAARTCYQSQGLAKTTISDIAREAKVSRRTVYRYFPTHDDITTAVVNAEADAFLQQLAQHLQNRDDFFERLIEAMLFCIQQGPESRYHEAMFGDESAAAVSRLYLNSPALYEHWEDLLSEAFQQAKNEERIRKGISLRAVIHWLTRITLSYIQVPSVFGHEERQLCKTLNTFVVAAIATDDATTSL